MAQEFKRTGGKDKRSSGPKKNRHGKRDDKPAFERSRDDSRPSDFGNPKQRSSSGYGDFRKKRNDHKPYKKREENEERPSYEEGTEEKKTFNKRFSDKPFKKKWEDKEKGDQPKKFKKSFSDKPEFKKKWNNDRDHKPGGVKPARNPYDMDEKDLEYGKPKSNYDSNRGYIKKPYKKTFSSSNKSSISKPQRTEDDGMMRLNKYLSNAGICSRREADDLISSGVVQVNGKTITEMGFRVKPTDIIRYGGQTLKKERMVYLILNKPKDYITTFDDPQKRKTVLELIQGACKERIYPVGRLDRATTGLLMFTNDGDLTKKLTHPRYGVRKIYHVELDKPLKHQDLNQITDGLELEDGLIKVDEITYVGDGSDKRQVGVEIHSGKNRIVRRIFEHLGYNVRKLDRVVFGSLTKKDLPRGRWRFLTEAEIGMLKMISSE
ncbi:MAG: pseudouridine synthase [Bacteroidota bacterium]